jgi:sorting nexin-7/30/sorting nexin-8
MAESIEDKQQFLRSQIMDRGYSTEEFTNFLGNIRGEEGLDLNNWSLADLQEVVNQFTSQYQYQDQQPQGQTYPQTNEIQNQEQNFNNNNNSSQEENPNTSQDNEVQEKTEQKPANNSAKGFPKDPFELYEHSVLTKKLEKTVITDNDDLFVTIKEPVRIKKGVFSSAYYQYTVETSPVGFKVVRRVSDFTFLYEKLPIYNSAVFNPVLPHFEIGLKDESPKKMLYIQNYVNSLVENPFFRTLPIVFEFLTLPQEEWEKKKQETYSKVKPPSLANMPTLEGVLNVKINKTEDNKAVKLKSEIDKKVEGFDEINIAMDELLASIEKVSLCFKSVARAFLNLSKAHKQNEVMFEIFKRLLNLSKTWSSNYLKERDFIRDELKYYFKFMNKENVSYLKKYEAFKMARDDYKNKYEKVKKMPAKSQKEVDSVLKLRRDYGLQLIMVNSEYDKLMERQSRRFLNQFVKYNQNKDTILHNFNNCIKLFNINEKTNDLENAQQDRQQSQDEIEYQNQNSGEGGEQNNSQQEY